MPKTPSNKLFRLIKSLSGSEKRYFKIFVNNKGSKTNKYIQLFDAIDLQENFDDEVLKEKVYAGQSIESRKYSELKSYLYELILKSLHSYDEKTSVDYKLKGMLQSVRALFKRSHFQDCKEVLQKAKKLAYKYEQFNIILEVLNWEKEIGYAQTDMAFLDIELERIDKEEKTSLLNLRNISEYRNILFRLLVSLRKDASFRNEKQKQNLKTIISHPLLADIQNAQSHKARTLFHRIYSIYYYSVVDFKSFYEVGKTLVSEMESKPYFLQEDVAEYISTLSNYIISCDLLQKPDEVNENLKKLKKIKPNTIDDELKIHRQYYNNKFRSCIVSGEFEEGLVELERHLKEIKKYNKSRFEGSSFYFQYFYIYFGVEDYDNALAFLNNWLNQSKKAERKELQGIARILNLILHYELGNTLLLDSLIRSTQRFLSKGQQLYEFERRFIGFMKNSSHMISNRSKKEAFQELQKDFDELSKIPSERTMLNLFNVEAWISSKIENKPFGAIVKQLYLERLKKGNS